MASYRSSARSRDVGSVDIFEPVVAALMMWDLHRAAGFRYRTLPGHPLEGDELCLVERRDGRTVFSVSERSRPARSLARLPGARAVQARINERYLAAAERVGAKAP